ncbi:hypothetical protein OROGR_016371 [Orobanche gracilis]
MVTCKYAVAGNLMVVLVLLICRGVPAEVYTVGDSSGWAMGADYSTWPTDKTFTVGDTLAFNYAPGHTVDEVSAKDYKSCTTGNSITTDSSGATSIALKTSGTHYFICGVPGHCSGGMKLAVTVAAAASGAGGVPSSTGAATSPPSTTTSMAPPSRVATSIAGILTQSSPSVAMATLFLFFMVFEDLVF